MATRTSSPDGTPREGAIPSLQRLMESIPFLVFIGLVMPTIVYTVWSITEIVMLPRFGDVGAHGPATTGASTGATGGTASAGADVAHARSGADIVGGVLERGTTVAPGAVSVSMRNMAYSPREVEVSAGTTVTWVNDDPFPHAVAHGTPDVPADAKAFSSGDFDPGWSFSYAFTEPGTYDVYCSTVGHFAAGMTMTVVVKE